MLMDTSGHVFVIHGDLLSISCNEVLVPTDLNKRVEEYLGPMVVLSRSSSCAGVTKRERVTESALIEGQLVRYVSVGTTQDRAASDWLEQGVRAALERCVEDAKPFHSRPGLANRAKWLVAIPLFGTRAGGFDAVRGDALQAVLSASRWAAAQGIDVAIVCRERRPMPPFKHGGTFSDPGRNSQTNNARRHAPSGRRRELAAWPYSSERE